MSISRWLLAALLVAPGLALAQDAGLTEQQARQREIKAETDRIVRRILTRLRSLRYNGFEETARQRTLEEAKKLLSGLSEKQMGDVIAALEKANISSGDART